MPKVTFVKSARSNNPVAKKGEPYYWWKFRYGGKRYSKTYPKASQLTQSSYLSQAYAIQEDIADYKPESCEDLSAKIEDWVQQIRDLVDECESNLSNMPDQLQDSDTGQLLQDRQEAMDQWASELENIETEFEPDDKLSDEEKEEALKEWIEDVMDQVKSIEPDIE